MVKCLAGPHVWQSSNMRYMEGACTALVCFLKQGTAMLCRCCCAKLDLLLVACTMCKPSTLKRLSSSRSPQHTWQREAGGADYG